MARPRASRLLHVVIAVALIGVAFAVACGTDDSPEPDPDPTQAVDINAGGETVTLDPARGDALAATALPRPASLPGEGWSETARDAFSDRPSQRAPGAPACVAIREMYEQLQPALDAERKGRANVRFGRPGTEQIEVSVEAEVAVFSGVGPARDVLNRERAALDPNDLACDREGFVVQFNEVANTIRLRRTAPLGEAPAGSIVYSANLSVDNLTFHIERYTWRYGNVLIDVSIQGNQPDVTAELVNSVLDGIQERLAAASTG